MVRLLLLALVCASCGRIAFDDISDGGRPGEGATTAASVQTVDVTMDATTNVATIPPVDPTRTLVLCDFRTDHSSAARQPACELTDATTVTVTVAVADPDVIAHVQLVQLPVGAFVQRGVRDMFSDNRTENVPIQTVDLATSFAVISRWVSLDTDAFDQSVTIAARLPAAQTLELSRVSGGTAVHVAWQVVQWPGSRVIANASTLGVGVTTGTVAIPAVDPTHTFIVASGRASSPNEEDFMVSTALQVPTMVAFVRTGSSTATYTSWFVVEVPSVSVSAGYTSMAGNAAVTEPIGPVDPARTAVFLSPYGGRPGIVSNFDEVVVTGVIGPQELILARNATPPTDVGGAVAWSVVELH